MSRVNEPSRLQVLLLLPVALDLRGDWRGEQLGVDFVNRAFDINFVQVLQLQGIEEVAGEVADDECQHEADDHSVHVRDAVEVEEAAKIVNSTSSRVNKVHFSPRLISCRFWAVNFRTIQQRVESSRHIQAKCRAVVNAEAESWC